MVGNARHLLLDFQLDDGMYEDSFNFVKNRFYNKRAIITARYSATLDKINTINRDLKVCGLDVPKMSPLITYIVVTKLPEKLRSD